ncbi:MAG TPA: hypothetical protein VHV54_27135 [Candidatus Binatia bacterium]|nr:hypothetical protein [Candidatus Binatia bacterium]
MPSNATGGRLARRHDAEQGTLRHTDGDSNALTSRNGISHHSLELALHRFGVGRI